MIETIKQHITKCWLDWPLDMYPLTAKEIARKEGHLDIVVRWSRSDYIRELLGLILTYLQNLEYLEEREQQSWKEKRESKE